MGGGDLCCICMLNNWACLMYFIALWLVTIILGILVLFHSLITRDLVNFHLVCKSSSKRVDLFFMS